MTTKNDILVALAEAREDAREKALAEGLAEGAAKGKAEGAAAKQIEVAKAMLDKDFPMNVIASVTGLTEEQVKSLQ